ncbi:MAG: hypothetical protein AVDCRST_MAG56-5996 [uncultured Cytophagales bacterium]|uniref:histidine kinase n=1 Tax=uncultured Cytophagales bacterium TaxID=158755 RepID=A0A6J4KL68_9SPHI|nr:MAG: hypothetical protein AVDCRST_MAG56-5996 [uncultured Cytophagales bacterium]
MRAFLEQLFKAGDFMPHGHCYFWQADILWLHVVSDGLIALAYFLIPYSIWRVIRRRQDLKLGWLLLLFALFIFSCGTTHALSIVTVWNPLYRLDGLVKAITAVASLGTALALVRIMPRLQSMPSRQEWERVNEQLSTANQELQAANEELSATNEELATANEELVSANEQLEAARQTVERLSAEALQASTQQYQDLAESISDPVLMLDKDLRYLYVNGAAAGVSGKQAQEMLGRTPREVFGEAAASLAFKRTEAIGRVLASGRKETLTDEATHGPVRKVFEITLYPTRAGNVLMLTRDVTQLVAYQHQLLGQQQALQASYGALEAVEKRLSSLVESQTNYLIRTDLEGKYSFVNNRFLEKFGFTREELLGAPYFPTVHPEDVDKCRQMALACITQPGKVVPLELRKLRRGELYYTDWEFIGITDAAGQVVEIQGVGHDITQRKQIELEQEQLFRDLYRKNQDLEQFSFITSHNLRAPVANLLGLVEIYNKEDLPDPINLVVIENLKLSAQRLDQVIADLNELLSVRNRQEERQEVSLAEILENVQLSVSQQLEKSGAHLVAHFAAPVVYSVKSYVQSILLNLVSNALKYRSPDRPPVVKVSSRRQDDFVVLAVEDNGLGIDLGKHGEKLFGLYKRFHTHTEGKGLGLHLVKTQAEAMGGKVEVASSPGAGSTFKVYFKAVP